jgi:hypothetical protein
MARGGAPDPLDANDADDVGEDDDDGADGEAGDDGPIDQPEGELPESLEEALLDAASELPGLTVKGSGDHLEFLVGSRLVATLAGSIAEFRLARPVAAAALRTPGTRPSRTAPDRLAFEPAELDLYALDRAVAWLRSAVRNAG